MKSYVLDTSALQAFRDKEPGERAVGEILRNAAKRHCHVAVSCITQMELFYNEIRRKGLDDAHKMHLQLKMLPIEFITANEDLLLRAGEFKAEYAFSLADAIIAATAHQKGATLVHKDPEFEPLAGQVAMEALPYKKSVRASVHSGD